MTSRSQRQTGGASRPVTMDKAVRGVIEELLEDSPGQALTIRAVAERLDIHVRTLQRRLGNRGSSFRDLLNECQYRRAVRELRRDGVQVREVAARLGYSDPSHFVRAFRRWTGCSPMEYRHGPPAREKKERLRLRNPPTGK